MESLRNTELSTILFEVEQRPIYLKGIYNRQGELFDDNVPPPKDINLRYSEIPRFQAITRVEDNYVFSVVADKYKLITNEEAVELGKQCFKSIFKSLNDEDMEVFHIINPKTKSFCHIDFIHKNGGFEPWQDDKWVPFLRVTNSYNRTKPLRFDLGFCRWICTNGLIFGDKTITFRYLHTKDEIAKTAKFSTNFGDLKQLEKEFIEKLHNLKRFYVPEKYMLPIACQVFDIQTTDVDLSKPRRVEQLEQFSRQVKILTERYFNEIGPNGYAALNVITDFATRPESYISQENMIDRFQKRSGNWTDDFITKIKDDRFSFEDYLGGHIKTAQVLTSLTNQ
jgi:hypothetical protein